MLLSYLINPLGGDDTRTEIQAEITTMHPASHYGLPVIVLPDGDALDLISWTLCGYQVIVASDVERAGLTRIGLS
jgi:hypothetical protein